MQPYVIKQGDFLAKLAYRFGFDADTVWSHPKNAPLRQLRSNPNLLWPTDILYIPDPPATPPTHDLTNGSTNTFTADAPTIAVTIKFGDKSLASQAYSIEELPDLPGATSAADGTVSLSAPVTLDRATIVFADSGARFACQIGNLDPIETLSGMFQRLQHLGFIDASESVGSATVESVRWGLLSFKAAQSDAAAAPAGGSAPPSMQPPSSAPPSSPPSTPPLMVTGSSSDSSDEPPPSSGTASADDAPPSSGPPDTSSLASDSGLSDEGVLDDETKQSLLSAHGS